MANVTELLLLGLPEDRALQRLCAAVFLLTYLAALGCVYGSLHAAGTLSVRFCGPSIVRQFFCDVPSLLALACPGEQRLEFAFVVGSCGFSFLCFALMVMSYAHVFSAVLRIPSAQGRRKTVSTCLPHLSVVALFLFSGIITYLAKNFRSSPSLKLAVSALYTVLPPCLNPVIYSLRNRDMRAALGKLVSGENPLLTWSGAACSEDGVEGPAPRLRCPRPVVRALWSLWSCCWAWPQGGSAAGRLLRGFRVSPPASQPSGALGCAHRPSTPSPPRAARQPPQSGDGESHAGRGVRPAGFRGGPGTQALLFLTFLGLYLLAVLGNAGMVVVIGANPPNPAYPDSLSALDVCYSSTIAPRALADCLRADRSMSFGGCATQFFFLSLFGTAEAFLLAAMAYDRVLVICSPLRYSARMSRAVSFLCGLGNAATQTAMTFSSPFCGSNEVNDFCDVPPLLALSCSDTALNELVLLDLCGSITVGTFLAVLGSYASILAAILRIRTQSGRRAAFSTCAAHLAGVSLFFGAVLFVYAQPGAAAAPEQSKAVSVFYAVVVPTLNPLVYSLRNKDVKRALRRLAPGPA
ncbi:LOW QUALITY PROTEIN: Olfactory receptor 12 [Galemys pyrenaicus]|uniref:Olfactory receptor 12 n=1 Tax=Galemys pyrenaicus TaxID=202257 RepID=A0A8J6DID6_GALPY|nr:LOW QUALITY PROTEIN: Olfactory receptor 12 [Galemys pyrenaicus]